MSTIQDSLTRQQLSMIMSKVYKSPAASAFPSVSRGVLNCPLFPFNGCLSVIDDY